MNDSRSISDILVENDELTTQVVELEAENNALGEQLSEHVDMLSTADDEIASLKSLLEEMAKATHANYHSSASPTLWDCHFSACREAVEVIGKESS